MRVTDGGRNDFGVVYVWFILVLIGLSLKVNHTIRVQKESMLCSGPFTIGT